MTLSREPRWLDASQQHSWRALVVGTTLLMDRLDDDLRRAFNISLTEYEILVRLSERPRRSIRMAHLADALAHSRSRVTHTIDRMEKAGYVVRGTTPEDGRGIVATMTDKGLELLAEAAPLHVEGVRSYLLDVADKADFDAVGRVMDAVSDQLIAGHPEMEIR
jgi:DNA-binding MarR family transcriptional regulator